MFEVCFYDRASYPNAHWWQRIGQWVISLFSGRYIHVDCRVIDLVLAADMASDSAKLFLRQHWPEPATVIRMHDFDTEEAVTLLHQYADRRLVYGWWDFCMVPFRWLTDGNGNGVICSELTAMVIRDLISRRPRPLPLIFLAEELENAHELTPGDLYEILVRYSESR